MLKSIVTNWILPYNKFWATAITALLMALSAKFNWSLGVDEHDVLYAIGVLGSIFVERVPNVPAED